MHDVILKNLPALSVWQPWAWLIVNGYKPLENRNWRTRYRGRVLIHAGQKFDQAGWDWVALHAELLGVPVGALPAPGAFERGGIVGAATIVDCVEDSESPWFVGDYGFMLEDAQPLPFEACRGMLGFFRPEVAGADV